MNMFEWTLLSFGVTAVLVLGGLFFYFTSRKGEEGVTDDPKKKSYKTPDIWQTFGLVDNTPNLIRAVVAGDTNEGPIVYYIADVEGPKYNPLHQYGPISYFTLLLFGKRVFGIPFIRKIRPLNIDRVVEKPTAPGSKRTLAEELEAKGETRWGLYRKFIRPTNHADMDSKDNVRFSVNSLANIEVVDPEPIFTVYKNNFMQMIDRIIGSYLKARIITETYDAYKDRQREFSEDKDKQKDFDEEEIQGLNILLEPIGIKVTQLTLSDPELHHDIQEAMERKAKAVQDAEVKRQEGEAERDRKKSVADGSAYEIERLAKAKRARFQELIDMYKAEGVTGSEAVDRANAMIVAEFNADAVRESQMVYAPGSNASFLLTNPTGGMKK